MISVVKDYTLNSHEQNPKLLGELLCGYFEISLHSKLVSTKVLQVFLLGQRWAMQENNIQPGVDLGPV